MKRLWKFLNAFLLMKWWLLFFLLTTCLLIGLAAGISLKAAPRVDKTVSLVIAGAGDDGVRQTWERQ